MINNNITFLSTQMVLGNFDILFPNFMNIQPEELLNPTIRKLWKEARQAATNLTTIQKFLKDYNAMKKLNLQFH